MKIEINPDNVYVEVPYPTSYAMWTNAERVYFAKHPNEARLRASRYELLGLTSSHDVKTQIMDGAEYVRFSGPRDQLERFLRWAEDL